MRVDDLHSRLRVPSPAPREAALSELFGIDAEVLAAAFAIAGESADKAEANARLTAYLETDAMPDAAHRAIATRDGYRKLLEGVADVALGADIPGGFRLTLSAPSSGGSGPASRKTSRSMRPSAASRSCGAMTGASPLPRTA